MYVQVLNEGPYEENTPCLRQKDTYSLSISATDWERHCTSEQLHPRSHMCNVALRVARMPCETSNEQACGVVY